MVDNFEGAQGKGRHIEGIASISVFNKIEKDHFGMDYIFHFECWAPLTLWARIETKRITTPLISQIKSDSLLITEQYKWMQVIRTAD